MDKLFYILFIRILPIAAKLLSPFDVKAKLWTVGRKGIFDKIKKDIANDAFKKIWMHCASLGEFEQAYPLLEGIKEKFPECKFVLTFFSPSGYEVQKANEKVDFIFYLPIDSKKNAEMFLSIVQPCLIFFIKYDYWYYYLKEANERKIPLFLASGIFLPHYAFFQWWGKMHRQMLGYFSHLFVQNESSVLLLQSISIKNSTKAGDTRFDRVLKVAAEKISYPAIENFISGRDVLIAGSTWLKDDEVLSSAAISTSQLKLIIAPHDINKERIKECLKLYKYSISYSVYQNLLKSGQIIPFSINVLIIDNIGILKYLYRYSTICYVGGGFGRTGIHNILEAAVYYKPVFFGPEFKNFAEAGELINALGAFSIRNSMEFKTQSQFLLSNEAAYRASCEIAGSYVKQKSGATKTIINHVCENSFLNC
jgi:3-deoxy-D-manno-octulosonic-acid transferase